MHNDFTLFLRTYPNGKKVVFYHAYDENGKRVGPWTTNSLTLTAARNYCNKLFKAGALIPNKNKTITFGEFANGFWERGSEYIKRQESRKDITDGYINNSNGNLVNQILPFFADVPLDKITVKDIEVWLLGFRGRRVIVGGKEEIKQYRNSYANTVFGTLKVMLDDAVWRGLVSSNPCEKVLRLKEDCKEKEILTIEEVQKLFPKNYKTIWEDREIAYVANRLGSLTGMRIGEILGLRGEFVYDNYILVCGQYSKYGYLPHTKTKKDRTIPLMPEMIGLLRKLMIKNGKGFLFSSDGGAVPVSQTYMRVALNDALKKIGIDKKEALRRGLTLHGWRHFVNTDLLVQGLTTEQVQSVTGHKSKNMTERYSHIDPRQIADVIKAQEKIYGKKPDKGSKTQPPETVKAKTSQQGLTLVKNPRRKTA